MKQNSNIKTKFLKIDNKNIEYQFFGNLSDNMPVLILLHEGLGSVSMWRHIPELIHLKTKLNVLVYSRFGYGKSSNIELPRPTNYMSIEADQYLPKIIKYLSIKNYFLVGHSDGGTIATIGSVPKNSESLIGTILIAPHFFVEQESINAIKDTTYQYEHKNLKSKLERFHSDVDNAFWGWSNVWLSPDFKNWNISKYLTQIRKPILALQGTNDPYGTINQINILEEKVNGPFDKVVIKDCGHNPFIEYTDKTMEHINSFVTKLV